MSATVWAWALHSLKRIAQSTESTGNESSEAIIASTALLSCFRVTMWVRGESAILASAFAQKPTGILQSGEKMRSDERFLHQLPATVSERQQMPGEIPAVHGGNVSWVRAGEDRACHTSCRNVRGTIPSGPWSPAWLPAARPFPACPTIRSLARKRWKEDRARYLWARFGARQRVWAFPENCREGARGPPGKRTFRRSATSGAQSSGKPARRPGDNGLAPGELRHTADPDALRQEPQPRERGTEPPQPKRWWCAKARATNRAERPPQRRRPCAHRSRIVWTPPKTWTAPRSPIRANSCA